MAESVVSVLVEKLDVFLSRKWDLVVELDDKIQSLRIDLEFLQAFLKDVDERGRDNERAKVWISQVRSIAFRAEDAIDEYLYKVWFRSERGFIGSLKNFADHSSRLRIRHHLAVEIEGINNRLQQIIDRRNDLGINFSQSKGDHVSSNDYGLKNKHTMLSMIDETKVVGVTDDLKKLKDLLLAEDTGRNVISIVGMGGMGKTTLARKVYNSDDVKRHFQIQAWVSVSQKYNIRELLQSILKSIEDSDGKGKSPEEKEDSRKIKEPREKELIPEEIRRKVKEYLEAKRYLLVIDDIWDRAAWDDIRYALPEGLHGSRIMVTTRIEEVARHIDPPGRFIHKPQCLTKNESWNLFCLRVFPMGEGCPDNIKKIGEEIVSKCAGLPLAIGVIGGLLSRKPKTEDEWSKLLKCIAYELNEVEDAQAINSVLMLSFDALPHYLRSCFLYFGLFPEDSLIDADVLIQMWVAEGFVKNRGQQTLEEVGEDYLEELANRSMIQVVERDLIGKISKCRIHDLLLELSISQGKEEKFSGVLQVGGSQFQNDRSSAWCPRRLALHGSGSVEHIVPLVHSSSLGLVRSVLGFDQGKRRNVAYLIGNLRLLRVLNLKGIEIRKLPKQIGQLVHLKFLGLEDAELETLPSSLGMLLNLQTLRIGSCRSMTGTLWKIETLRHIFVWLEGEFKERKLTRVTSCRANLQTLRRIRAGDWIGRCLHKFTNLRVLSITDIRENHVAMLVGGGLERLLHLTRLTLYFTLEEEGEGRCIVNVKHVLAKLENFPSLHHLRIYRFGDSSTQKGCSSWMCGLFGNTNLAQLQNEGEAPTRTPSPLLLRFPTSLVRLELGFPRGLFSDEEQLLASLSCCSQNLKILYLGDDVYRGKELTFSHNYIFPKLEELELYYMRELEECSIGGGGGGDGGVTIFPSLKYLTIYYCGNLKAVPEGLQHITTLQELSLYELSDELEGRLEQGGGEDWDKIKHIPSVFVNHNRLQVEQQQQMSLSAAAAAAAAAAEPNVV